MYNRSDRKIGKQLMQYGQKAKGGALAYVFVAFFIFCFFIFCFLRFVGF